MDFDNHDGEMYRGVPYIKEVSGLVSTKEDKVFDYSRRIRPEELNKIWVQVEGKAYVGSFNKGKALVYCIAFRAYSKDKVKTIIVRGHLYNTPYLDPIQQYPEKTWFLLELKPIKWSLFPIKTASIGDKQPRPVEKILDETNRMLNEETASPDNNEDKEEEKALLSI